jgi:Carbohydrate-binding family 9
MKAIYFSVLFFFMVSNGYGIGGKPDTLQVNRTSEFEPDGKGSHANWDIAPWQNLAQLDSGLTGYDTRFKVMYSGRGLYVLFDGLDKKITTTYDGDFDNLFNGDVFEVFLHPTQSDPLYLEYEINALNKELVLLIPNMRGRSMGWRPWHYEGERLVKKNVFVTREADSMVKWTAEFFIPFRLLEPMQNIRPKKGDSWHANFYRLDYDNGSMVKWSWSPVEKSFHEFEKYGVIKFN